MHQLMDGDVGALLRELVEFLECLEAAELPEAAQAKRESLLARARLAAQQPSAAESPEPYLDMSAGRSLQLTVDETDQPQEYVSPDSQQRGPQRGSLHYYETFQDFQGNGGKNREDGKTETDKELDNLVLLYASFSAAQAKEKAVKSGSLLHLRRERKMFAPFNVFWLNRSCWVSLVGSHLLLYASERESRPYLVVPLRGYKGRPAPGALARDPRRSEAAFEIYCPGERTFQFVAKGAAEMSDWVDAVSHSLGPEPRLRPATFAEILRVESNERICMERVKEEKDKYQDVLGSPKSKTKDKQPVVKAVTPEKEKVEEAKEDAPPLPARRGRLPSLPSQEEISYEPREELYDEEGLYHRIEDIKAQREYQNCQIRADQAPKRNTTTVDLLQETYDDVESAVDRSKESSQEPTETYDDVHSISQDKINDEPISYDDVQSVAENVRGRGDKEKSPKATKPISKRSFLDRMINRKDSIRKEDKKTKSTPPPLPTSPPPSLVGPVDLPCYDDVSSTARDSCADEENYLSPPPPRPIYSRPPTIIKCAVPGDEIYDDIGCGVETSGTNGCKGCVDVVANIQKNGSFLSDLQLSIDREHYQVPRANNRKVEQCLPSEELYDDVALSETFKSRPRDPVPEKSVWSRLGSGKIPRIFDRQSSANESTEYADDSAKVKSLQKLIIKMENSLGKSAKPNSVA